MCSLRRLVWMKIGFLFNIRRRSPLGSRSSRQSEVLDMQQLSREIIIEHDLLLQFNTKLLCTVSILIHF